MTITLTIGAGLLLLNIWLMMRCGKARMAEKVFVGDSGNEFVVRRMRAHANFAESAPLVLIVLGALEYAQANVTWLWALGIIFVVGRIAHAFGMDGGALAKGRMIGTLINMLVQLSLAATAIWLVYSGILSA